MNKETIEIPLKKATYEELQETIIHLITDNYLKQQELERYKNIIDELETYLENGIKDEKEKNIIKENLSTWQILEIILDKLKELKGE